MANCVIAYNPCFSCDEKKCKICELDMHRKRVFQQSEGEWKKRTFIIFDSEKVGYNCSECNTTWDTETKFCPNCGAKMKGGAE